MKTDLQNRLALIRSKCRKAGVSHLVTRNIPDILYLTGVTPHATGDVIVLIGSNRITIFTDARYAGTVNRVAAKSDLITTVIWDRKTMADDIVKRIRKGGSLGFEENEASSHPFVKAITKAAKKRGIHVKGVNDLLVVIRSVKTPREISILREAGAISDEAFKRILRYVRPGVTELAIAQRLGRFLRELSGCEDLSFATIVASGPNGAIPHATATNRKIREGDMVTLDFGCVYRGFHSDVTRTVFVGPRSGTSSRSTSSFSKLRLPPRNKLGLA